MRIPTAYTGAFFFSFLLYLATFENLARLVGHIIMALLCLVFRPSRLVSSRLVSARIEIGNGGGYDMIWNRKDSKDSDGFGG